MTGRLEYYICRLCKASGTFRNPECRKCRAALNVGRQEKHKLLQRRLRLTAAVNRILRRFSVDDEQEKQVLKDILHRGIKRACQPLTPQSSNDTQPTAINARSKDDSR